ncbi:MAG: hypothetical protein PHI06_09230 [Desulfobulbaceae bacterium]|nr:hypothetical protein [Desulfobulbaceae bacterium]
MSVDTPVEVGFAEFIARLMSEVFDAVITSQVDQEQRYAMMHVAASLSAAEYRNQYISDDDVDAELRRLFPPRSVDNEHPHMIWEKSPYTPAKGEREEDPPVFATIGVTLDKRDIAEVDGGLGLGAGAVQKIIEAVAMTLAEGQLALSRQLVGRGLPRVVVDAGKINGKLTFNLTTNSSTPEPVASTPRAAAVLSRLDIPQASIFSLPKARILPNVKLMVKQADATSPQSSQVKANVYGEVEITFKTVT